jgi:peptidoglycan/LPS O-acetylase OafA/YrhL
MDASIGSSSSASAGLVHERRADLQGLRAVAVLAVIAYHFGVPGASGGFVGVDVFFVLSGFFITRLLMRDIEEHGRIRLTRFWANRVKRLLPNALLVVLCVLVGAALMLPSYRLAGISQDAVSAAAFFANFHFAARAVDYFHLDDPASPLLHYWSLSIEEQFYLVLPLAMSTAALLARHRAKRVVVVLLAAVAVLSFTASLVAIEHSQPVAFFHPWYRAWQLACGGLTGLLFDRRAVVPAMFRGAGAVLGFVAIATSIVLLTEDMPYPGILALAPTLGTAALIYGLDAGRLPAGIARFLVLPAMVVVGDMSYSLYLWHWPVAVFIEVLWPVAGIVATVGALAVTAVLAGAAYIFVERPIHRIKFRPFDARRILAAGVAAVGVVVAASAGTVLLPSRTDATVAAKIAEASEDLGQNYKNGCHLWFEAVEQPACRFGRIGGPRVVLFGDSHAAQWYEPLVKAGEEAGWEVDVWTKTSCPTADVIIWYPPARAIYTQCSQWRAQRLRELLDNPPELVVFGNFSTYYGWIYDKARGKDAARSTSERLWQEGMKRTGEALIAVGIRVVEMRDTPHMYQSYKDCLSEGQWDLCSRPRKDALAGMVSPSIDSPLYSVLDLSDALCSPSFCPAVIDGAIAYFDSLHITARQALTLYSRFLPILQPGR